MSALRTLIGPSQHGDGAQLELVTNATTLLPGTLRSTASSDLEVLLTLSGAIATLLTTSPELRTQFVALLEVDGASEEDLERISGWLEETFAELTLVKLAEGGRRTAGSLRALGIGEDECRTS